MVLTDEYTSLCGLIYDLEPKVGLKMLFHYPYSNQEGWQMGGNCNMCLIWDSMPEGCDFWEGLHQKIEELRRGGTL